MGSDTISKVFEEFAELCFGGFVVLLDGEVEGVLEDWSCFSRTVEGEQCFAFENFGHHPVVFFGDAEVEVGDGVGVLAVFDERLCEGEAEEFVVWIFGYEGLEAFGFHVWKCGFYHGEWKISELGIH